MNNAGTTQKPGRRIQNRLYVLLLVLGALASGAKDIERLQAIGSGVHSLASSGLRLGATVYASGMVPAEKSCAEVVSELAKTEEFRSAGQISSGQTIGTRDLNGSISAEPTTGGEIEMVAIKKAHRTEAASVDVKAMAPAKGVTICAVYPRDSAEHPNTRKPGNAIVSGLRTSGNSGYARSKTVNGEITAKMGNANWTDSLEFRTVKGGILLDLPADLSRQIEADIFNGDVSSEFPLTTLGRISRKHLSGTIGAGGRALVLKTLNGSIRLRHIG